MIFFETAGQARTFLLLLYAGFGAGLLYDLLTWPRRFLPRFCAPILDALWCLLTGGMAALALAAGGEHSARLFALAGLACGVVVYALGIRALARSAIQLLRRKRNGKDRSG